MVIPQLQQKFQHAALCWNMILHFQPGKRISYRDSVRIYSQENRQQIISKVCNGKVEL